MTIEDAVLTTGGLDHAGLTTRVAQMRAAIDGQLSDKGRLIDYLLDIRNDADAPALIGLVDELLVEMPGLTVVENKWWTTALDRLEMAASPTTV